MWKILVLGLLVGICIFVSLRIREGRLGRAWLAIREDELAASMMGVPLVNVKLLAYAVGAFFGWCRRSRERIGDHHGRLTVRLRLRQVGAGAADGRARRHGQCLGVTMGAFLLAWLNSNGLKQIGVQIDQIFGTDIAGVLPRYNYIILGLLLVLMMLFRREGLFPESRTRALLHEPSRTEAEALGAESIEAEAETEAVEHSDAAKDARLVAAAVAMSPVLEEPEDSGRKGG